MSRFPDCDPYDAWLQDRFESDEERLFAAEAMGVGPLHRVGTDEVSQWRSNGADETLREAA